MNTSLDLTTPPRITTDESAELDAISSLAGWQTDYQQIGPGKFNAWFDIYSSPHVTVTSQYCNQPLLVSGSPPAGHTALVLPLTTNTGGTFNGCGLEGRDGVLFSDQCDTQYRSPADLRLLTVVVPTYKLISSINSLDGNEDGERLVLGWHHLSGLAKNLVVDIEATFKDLLLYSRSGNGEVSDNLSLSEAEQTLINIASRLLSNSRETSVDARARANHHRAVQRARDFIDANLAMPLNLQTIAEVSGASQRTLETAFKHVLDLTPGQYIKSRRLTAVNEKLLHPDTDKLTVSAVARSYGFNHMGHFGQDYRALFDERPMQTLTRARRLHS